ncbi:serine hydroxymethyltransferase-like [Triplophysa rosa]|uniref:serine hydroxymethyltransferase-like n=1 Tax=Triplophysa rosa TaxID=992332 RepID=UPI0025461886|nr:serine hydroxymethyltransferase-like [Triplophysa rosa]
MISDEFNNQNDKLKLIASENYASLAVIQAQGTFFTNKYAEGYPGRRFYAGCEEMDRVENKAIELACKLFNCKFANVQPCSGSQANQAVMFAFLNPGDKFLAMSLKDGGHLTHGHKITMSGKWFSPVHYHVNKDGFIDMNEVRKLALENKPKLIICGASAYSRKIDFAAFRSIADEVGAILLSDIAHYSGLIAGKAYPSPFPYSHVVTTTTHKTLRGPRGGMILCDDKEIADKIDRAVFPGIQGGPLMHVIAAKLVAFEEALSLDFAKYASQVVKNAKVVADVFKSRGIKVFSGGTDSHLVLLDLTNAQISGIEAENILNWSGLVVNKNAIPNDNQTPFIASGIRIGTSACTTRGMKEKEFEKIANMICDKIENQRDSIDNLITRTKIDVAKLCNDFPIYYKKSFGF